MTQGQRRMGVHAAAINGTGRVKESNSSNKCSCACVCVACGSCAGMHSRPVAYFGGSQNERGVGQVPGKNRDVLKRGPAALESAA